MKKNNIVKIESGIDYKNHYDNTSDMAVTNLAKNGPYCFGRTSRKNFSFYVQYNGDYCGPVAAVILKYQQVTGTRT